jgi:hypothetical protein
MRRLLLAYRRDCRPVRCPACRGNGRAAPGRQRHSGHSRTRGSTWVGRSPHVPAIGFFLSPRTLWIRNGPGHQRRPALAGRVVAGRLVWWWHSLGLAGAVMAVRACQAGVA